MRSLDRPTSKTNSKRKKPFDYYNRLIIISCLVIISAVGIGIFIHSRYPELIEMDNDNGTNSELFSPVQSKKDINNNQNKAELINPQNIKTNTIKIVA